MPFPYHPAQLAEYGIRLRPSALAFDEKRRLVRDDHVCIFSLCLPKDIGRDGKRRHNARNIVGMDGFTPA